MLPVAGIILRLKKAGMDNGIAELLIRLSKECGETLNPDEETWSCCWYEIDRLRAIERITVRGTLKPVKAVSVLRETAYDAGTVKPNFLRREILFDLNLVR